jgi:hypothetical protein
MYTSFVAIHFTTHCRRKLGGPVFLRTGAKKKSTRQREATQCNVVIHVTGDRYLVDRDFSTSYFAPADSTLRLEEKNRDRDPDRESGNGD